MSPERAELERDTAGFSEKQLEPFLQEALDSMIDDLFDGRSVGGLHLDAYVEQFAEEIAAMIYKNESYNIRDRLDTLIRRELEGSDALHERAAELANQPEE